VADKELALAIIEEDVDIHRRWVAWNIENEEHINTCSECKIIQNTAGNVEWHTTWLNKYEVVYKTLKEL